MVAAGWIALSEETYGNRYQYPALYSNGIGGLRAVLDMTEGDKVGDWIIVSSSGDNIISSLTSSTSIRRLMRQEPMRKWLRQDG